MKKVMCIIAGITQAQNGQLPEWYTIFQAGEGDVEGIGSYLVTKESFDLVAAEIARRGIDIVFDYEHQTLADTKAPAAGWCREWRWQDGVGIQARIDWTDEAAGYLKKGEYRYYSPVFHIRKSDGLLMRVHSVALTNAPRTNHIAPLMAKLAAAEQQRDKEDRMDLLKKLIEALGLKPDSTEDEVVAAVAKMHADGKGHDAAKGITVAVAKALGIDEAADESTIVASIHAMNQEKKHSVSRAEFDALQAKLAQRDAGEMVAAAMSAGKITPDQKEWATEYAGRDPEGFRTFVAKAPVVITTTPLPDDHGTRLDITDQTTLAVAKLLDVSAEDLKKYGGLQ